MRQTGLFGLSDHLKRLSADGDPLEALGRIVDFKAFRPTLIAALAYGDGARGGRPPYDPVAMFKVLILSAQNTVSDARMEYLIRDRLSWLRFLGFDLGAPTPDANTIPLFREKLTEAGALETLFADFDCQLKERGYIAMGGQIVDATLVAAPKQRNTQAEKEAIKAGKSACEIWPDEPARTAQKDTDARWTLKFAKAKPTADGKPGIDIAIPSFGYKSSISICRAFAFIRKGRVTDGARFDGRMLRDVVTNDNTASDVWADTAYRSQANEKWLKRQSRVSRIHRKKPRGKPMPARTARANAAKSKVRARVEHVFARQKDQMGLFIRTIGIKRAEAKITLANLAYNMNRLIFHERRAAIG
ncbi:IS5 family transposase [Sphingomonas sp. BE270]|jgi:IS5 family transposase|uniref:IS5 family transposase n=1 Tax=Sphingomonas sp. BE270 TaxID=2817726 RepID=UPI002861CBEC|nr:IS5 family transposase [Sphingomonas sp. BE270]MDR7260281.1 IS5 family transposase [Sphingomonas sp. BE270]